MPFSAFTAGLVDGLHEKVVIGISVVQLQGPQTQFFGLLQALLVNAAKGQKEGAGREIGVDPDHLPGELFGPGDVSPLELQFGQAGENQKAAGTELESAIQVLASQTDTSFPAFP